MSMSAVQTTALVLVLVAAALEHSAGAHAPGPEATARRVPAGARLPRGHVRRRLQWYSTFTRSSTQLYSYSFSFPICTRFSTFLSYLYIVFYTVPPLYSFSVFESRRKYLLSKTPPVLYDAISTAYAFSEYYSCKYIR